MKHISFFAGARGFDLAAEKAGWENVASVEIDASLNRRFAKRFPHAQHKDIRETDFRPYRGIVDIISGGFPCQPFSTAGERKGTDDERHLWPEMLRGVREISPRWVVGENVRGIVSWSGGLVFEQVHADLESEGYEVQAFVLPAASINAPHERYRSWFIAHSNRIGGKGQQSEGISGTGKKQPSFAAPETGLEFTSNANRKTGTTKKRADSERSNSPEERERLRPENRHNGGAGDSANAECQQHDRAGFSRGRGDEPANSGEILTNTHGGFQWNVSGEPGKVAKEQPVDRNSCSAFDAWDQWTSEPPVCGVDDGVPVGMDVPRLRADLGRLYPAATEKEIERAIQKTITKYRNEMIKAFGNAVVWQIPYRIFQAINQYESLYNFNT